MSVYHTTAFYVRVIMLEYPASPCSLTHEIDLLYVMTTLVIIRYKQQKTTAYTNNTLLPHYG